MQSASPLAIAWAHAAEELGLALYEPSGSYERGASFSRLKRAMGTRLGAPTPRAWMYGKWRPNGRERGVEALALVHTVHAGDDSISFTHTIARVDPPFHLGIDLRRRGQPGTLGSLHVTGDPAFDHAFALDAVAPTEAAAVFRRSTAPSLCDRLMGLVREWDAQIGDAAVDVFTRQLVVDPAELARRLEAASAVAAELGERTRGLAEPTARAARWQTFAEAEGLALDRERMILTGDVGGLRVRIGLEGEPCMLFTVVVAEMPKLLGVGLRLARHSPFDAIAELFTPQDIRVGDRVFDDVFSLRGEPSGVLTLFARADLRLAIHELSLGAKDVTMDDARLYLRYPLAVDDETRLAGITHRLGVVAEGLAATRPRAGPYR